MFFSLIKTGYNKINSTSKTKKSKDTKKKWLENIGREAEVCLNPHSNGASLLASVSNLNEIKLEISITKKAIKNTNITKAINSKIVK